MDDFTPETQPSGSLVPPPRVPPIAIATSAPLSPRSHPRHPSLLERPRRSLRDLVESALDELDRVGDRIAGAVGLR